MRGKLGLRAGSRLTFVATASGSYEIHVHTSSVKDLRGVVPRPSELVTLEEMDEAVAVGAAETTTMDRPE